MKIHSTQIPGVAIVEGNPFVDSRGSFSRFFCRGELEEIFRSHQIVQINHSQTKEIGAIRGLHFQYPPFSEMKLIRCIKGKVWDVAVDLRAKSPTFLKWHAEELSPSSCKMMIIPEGCAHGFQVLESNSELIYFHTAFYNPKAEAGILYNEPRLNISWPIPIKDISLRDNSFQLLKSDFIGVSL